MNSPEVTVAIPSNGRWPLLARSLRSALAQTGPGIEVIVALDTPDGAAPPSEVLGLCDCRVHFLRADKCGLSHARNAAIQAARGKWIAFLDDDDLWAPTKLDRQLRAGGERVDFVYGAAVVVDEELAPLETHPAPPHETLARDLLKSNAVPAGASNVIVRADVVRRCDGFDTQFCHLADWDMWIRLAASARPAEIAEVIVAQVRHPDSMLFQGGDIRREFEALARKHSSVASALGERFDDSILLGWLHARYLAAGQTRRARLLRLRHPLRSRPRLLGRLRLIKQCEWAGAIRPVAPVGPGPRPQWLLAERQLGGNLEWHADG
jgi:glycosyltransferase involved in cell wall biosynthesis